jgi:hypothetical protein
MQSRADHPRANVKGDLPVGDASLDIGESHVWTIGPSWSLAMRGGCLWRLATIDDGSTSMTGLNARMELHADMLAPLVRGEVPDELRFFWSMNCYRV